MKCWLMSVMGPGADIGQRLNELCSEVILSRSNVLA